MMKKLKSNKSGQAVVEYMLVLAVITFIGIQIVRRLSVFLNESIGNMAYVMSIHLSTGSCKNDCFYSGYVNGKEI